MKTRLGVTVVVALAMVASSATRYSAQVQFPPDRWTQIGHGLLGNPLGPTHNQSGSARQAAWRQDGRQGGRTVLWVGTERGGLWKSIVNETGDVTGWVPLTDNFPGPHPLGSFLVHRLDSDKILIGPGGLSDLVTDSRVYRTHDQGATWLAHDLPKAKQKKNAITRLVDDRSDDTGNRVLAATASGIYRSEDFGNTWDRVWKGAVVSDIVQDTGDPAIWYAAALRATPNVILRSPDHGATWQPMPLGTEQITGTVGRIALTTCASNEQVLYALIVTDGTTPADDGGGLNGLYRSTDRGRNWTKIFHDNDAVNSDFEGLHTCALGCDPADAGHVVFGLAGARETFTGLLPKPLSQWRKLDGGHGDYNGMLFRPGHSSIVITNDGGVFIYHPNGESEESTVDDSLNLLGIEANWQRALNGLAASRSAPDLFLAGLQDEGVAIGDVATNTVRQVYGGDGGQGSIMPDNPLILAASTNSSTGKYVSFDGGVTWTVISSGLPQQKFASLLIDPTPGLDEPLIFTTKLITFGSQTSTQVVFRFLSPDLLLDWLPVSPDSVNGTINHIDHTTDPDVHQIIGTADGHRALFNFSGPRGQIGDYVRTTITPPLEPLIDGGKKDAHANADKSVLQPDTIYYTTGASRPSQAFISTNGGQSWREVTGDMPTDGPNFVKLVANPRNLDQMFLATTSGVYRTDTGSKNSPVWTPYSEGLRLNENIQDIVINIHGLDQPTLYVAANGRGFWKRAVQ